MEAVKKQLASVATAGTHPQRHALPRLTQPAAHRCCPIFHRKRSKTRLNVHYECAVNFAQE
jgi:hypothetical protein